jgi:hypothetical protein
MISETGENLDIVINTRTGEDWKAFAAWYSITKNLPDSRIFLVCNRTMKVEIRNFQWAKRLSVRHVFQNPVFHDDISNWLQMVSVAQERGLAGRNVLLIDAKTMVLSPLDEVTIVYFNQQDYKLSVNQSALFVNGCDIDTVKTMIDNVALDGDPGFVVDTARFCFEAREEPELRPIVSYRKGCGKWIDSMKGCPFSNASEFISEAMEPNELRIIEMWRKMVPLYSTAL